MTSQSMLRLFFPADELSADFPSNLRRPITCAATNDPPSLDTSSTTSPVETSKTAPCSNSKRTLSMLPTAAPAKRTKLTGGHAPLPKKVVANMDSDDEIIYTMKLSGYKDREIQQRLADEGRTLYNPKTISTRFARQRKVMEAHTDKLLEEQLTEWHESDDALLHQSHTAAQLQVAAEIAQATARLWPYTAERLRTLTHTPRYSASACEARHAALQARAGGANPYALQLRNPTTTENSNNNAAAGAATAARKDAHIKALAARQKASAVAAAQRDAARRAEEARVLQEQAQAAQQQKRRRKADVKIARAALGAADRAERWARAREIAALRERAVAQVRGIRARRTEGKKKEGQGGESTAMAAQGGPGSEEV